MNIRWEIKKFEELNTIELYRIMQLRLAVFSVEQNCAYQDADGKDLHCFHLMGIDQDGDIIAYSRIVPAGISFSEVSIGRVISSAKARGTGSGKELMKKSVEFIQQKYGKVPIRIGAQCYLIKFYSGFGFEISGEEYLEDNIPHVEMLYTPR
ncbi:GNAT family N-acetyltransferase [soil metagenome]